MRKRNWLKKNPSLSWKLRSFPLVPPLSCRGRGRGRCRGRGRGRGRVVIVVVLSCHGRGLGRGRGHVVSCVSKVISICIYANVS